MADWTLLLVPVLVLPIVLLFRFVGCNTVLDLADDRGAPPNYRDFILGLVGAPSPGDVRHPKALPNKNNVIAYWRLLDAQTLTQTGVPAKDENGFQDGIFSAAKMDPVAPNGGLGSEYAPGKFGYGGASLIESDPGQHCRQYLGGYVLVPYKAAGQGHGGLYTYDFTIEAWILTGWGANIADHAHTLFFAGGFYRPAFSPTTSPTLNGFDVFIDGDNRCQVTLAPQPYPLFVTPPPPLVPLGKKTHIALTVGSEGSLKRVQLFIDGNKTNSVTVPAYFPPFDAPLFIGADNKSRDPANPPVPYRPIVSYVQEVVLHNKALSDEEIQNHVDINR